MHKFNDGPGVIESVHTQDLSPEDTLTSWSLDDFLDTVPRSIPWEDRDSTEVLGEFIR
ncbi:MAG: hypothetical protein USCGTAYLOR_02679 [Chromatiales bacterium USCg_Taylor]|nr:MAG: hypothetical protein USCGTAYLOR_02679 [Chromatiales bacterium USCg_Taylor]